MLRPMALVAALLMSTSPAAAAVTIDQQFFTIVPAGNAPVISRVGQVPPPPTRPGPSTVNGAVQTFTAGQNGVLDHFEFQAANMGLNDGILLMSLIDGDYAAGARTVLWQDGIGFAGLPSRTAAGAGVLGAYFDVSGAGYRVTAGQRYSVLFEGILFAPDQNAGLIIGYGTLPGPTPPVFTGPGYAGGQLVSIVNGVTTTSSSVYDVGFRSYIDVSAVPEPATWATMILGFGLLGAGARRRPGRSPVSA